MSPLAELERMIGEQHEEAPVEEVKRLLREYRDEVAKERELVARSHGVLETKLDSALKDIREQGTRLTRIEERVRANQERNESEHLAIHARIRDVDARATASTGENRKTFVGILIAIAMSVLGAVMSLLRLGR